MIKSSTVLNLINLGSTIKTAVEVIALLTKCIGREIPISHGQVIYLRKDCPQTKQAIRLFPCILVTRWMPTNFLFIHLCTRSQLQPQCALFLRQGRAEKVEVANTLAKDQMILRVYRQIVKCFLPNLATLIPTLKNTIVIPVLANCHLMNQSIGE